MRTWNLALTLAFVAILGCAPPPAEVEEGRVRLPDLRDGWRLAAAADVAADGEAITRPDFDASGWTETSVPSTVLAALVRNGVYEDPYFAKNLEEIPTEPFAGPWWYRKTFELDEVPVYGSLVLEGVNYRAEVWLNGFRVKTPEEIVGAFRVFDLDVTDTLAVGPNVLAIEVFPPRPGDFTVGFVDWNPTAPDRNMGLWRGVEFRSSGAVSLHDVFVTTDLETSAKAIVTVEATAKNRTVFPATARVRSRIEGEATEVEVVLEPEEERRVRLVTELREPRLWWPNGFGEPSLYDLELAALVEGAVSDEEAVRFGVREVEDYVDENGYRGYKVNGQKVQIRGGGWVDDLMLADSDERVEAQVRYARHMNLNTLRLEGFWGSSQKLYDLADENGILLMPGWSCQWEWEDYLGKPVDEYGGVETAAEIDLVARSLRDQVVWLRNHPSIFVWVLGSDMLPRPDLERRYVEDLAEIDPTRPLLASCGLKESEVTGSTGVKMNGPYDYVTPNYWYVDTQHGGAYGFNTETGPGPQPPPIESLRRMLPEEHLWPIDEMWEYHCGRNQFNTLDNYVTALDARYGPSGGVQEFAMKAQVANYEAMRAMFEAFSVNRDTATGVVQWMFNSAWPAMYWQLFDYYLMPNGAFYGARTAGEPLNLIYHYGDRGVYVTNDTPEDLKATVRVRLFGLDGALVHEASFAVGLSAREVARLGTVPELGHRPVAFLDLRLEGKDRALGRDFYWLSAKDDVLDFVKTSWYHTPNESFADFTALEGLPTVGLEVSARREESGVVRVRLKNPAEVIAFFVELKVVDKATGRSILPIFWGDNYVSLLPGEELDLGATFDGAGREVVVEVSGWNVERSTSPPL